MAEINAAIGKGWPTAQLSSDRAGQFALRGYLADEAEIAALQLYLENNFPYPYSNQLLSEQALENLLQGIVAHWPVSAKIERNGISLFGHVPASRRQLFAAAIAEIEEKSHLPVAVDVVYPLAETIDLSNKYHISGRSQGGGKLLLIIDGHLLGIGDQLDGMTITAIEEHRIWLACGELLFSINYSL